MPLRPIRPGDTVIYRNADGDTANVLITSGQGIGPPAPTAVASESGGTLAAATYRYKLTYTLGGVESAVSANSNDAIVAGATGSVNLTWGAITGASNYKIYGRTGGSFLQMFTGTALTFLDTAAVTPSGAAPSTTGAATLTVPHEVGAGSVKTGVLPGMTAGTYENRW
jgi:hypothetical protein